MDFLFGLKLDYLSQMNEIDLKAYVRDVPYFPKQGIIFKDLSPLLASAKARKAAVERLAKNYQHVNVDVVVGIEARGFLFGTLLAEALGASFVMCRKQGKLPGDLRAVTYDLEYGTDTVEMQIDAFSSGSSVLLHDDVLATGGTAAAAIELIESMGGNLIGVNFILELDFLKGRTKLAGRNLYSLINY